MDSPLLMLVLSAYPRSAVSTHDSDWGLSHWAAAVAAAPGCVEKGVGSSGVVAPLNGGIDCPGAAVVSGWGSSGRGAVAAFWVATACSPGDCQLVVPACWFS